MNDLSEKLKREPVKPKDGDKYTEQSRNVRADNQSPVQQVFQVETLGRLGMIVILVMFVVIAGLAVLSGYSLGAGDQSRADTTTQLNRMNSRVSVLEYDNNKMCAQLLAKGIIEVCH